MVKEFEDYRERKRRDDIEAVADERGIDMAGERLDRVARAQQFAMGGLLDGFGCRDDVRQEQKEVQEAHENRSERAQTVDERRAAKLTLSPEKWKEKPGEYDFPGVDDPEDGRIESGDFVDF
jgi:hypothetical protein